MQKQICTTCNSENFINAKYCSRCGHSLLQSIPETTNEHIKQPTTEKKSNKFIGIIAAIVAFVLSYWGVQQLFFKSPSLDKAIMMAASELNKTCPIMIDQDTRLDNAVALPDNAFQYNYTLINIERSQVNVDTLKKYIEPEIINSVKTSPDLKFYRDNKTTMVYYYRDRNGIFILKLYITPDKYE